MRAAEPPGPIGSPESPGVGVELARGAASNAAALALVSLRGIFTLLIAWLLGQAALGTFALAYAVVYWLSMVATLGLDTGVMARVAQASAEGDLAGSRRMFRRAAFLGLAAGVLTAVAGFIAVRRVGPAFGQDGVAVEATALLMLSLPGTALYRICNGVSRGMGVMRHDVYSRGLVDTLVTTGGLLVAIHLGAGSLAPVVAVVAGASASGLVALVLARRLFLGVPLTADVRPVSAPLLTFSAPIAGYNMLNTLIGRADVMALGLCAGHVGGVTLAQVGVFAAAAEIAGVMRKLRQVFDPIFIPVLARQSALGDAAAQVVYHRIARWILAAELPILGLILASGGIILSVFGPGFSSGEPWLAILALAHATNAFVGLAESVIVLRRPALNLFNSAITAVVQVACTLWLIAWLGVIGAAVGALIAYLTQGILRWFELRVLFGWSAPWVALRRPALAAAAAAPAILLRLVLGGWPGQVMAGLLYVIAYGVAWRLLGLEPADREVLNWLRRRPGASGAAVAPSEPGG